MPVVVMNPSVERGRSLRGMLIGNAAGPFPQRRLDEALGFAVGLRPIGAREQMLQSQSAPGAGKYFRAEHRTVVSQDAADGDSELREILHGGHQESDRIPRGLGRLERRQTAPGMIIYRHKQELPAGAGHGVPAIASN